MRAVAARVHTDNTAQQDRLSPSSRIEKPSDPRAVGGARQGMAEPTPAAAKRKRDDEPEAAAPADAEAARLEELRLKRLRAVQAMRMSSGTAAASQSAPAEATAGTSSAAPEPNTDNAGGDDAYFDREEEVTDTPGEATNGHAGGSALPANGEAFNGDGGRNTMPSSVDSTVEPDERADALEAYMAQIEQQQGALSNRPAAANSRCVLLEHLLTAAQSADADEVHSTRMDTGHECSRWGALLRVHAVGAFDEQMNPYPEHVAGRVFVEFEQVCPRADAPASVCHSASS